MLLIALLFLNINVGNASCSNRPPPGKTYLTIGQDLFSINEYVIEQYNASLHSGRMNNIKDFIPSAVMVYTSLFSFENGTSLPTDYGSGVEYADGLLNSIFPNEEIGLQIGLWLEGEEGCDKINSGEAYDEIMKMIRYIEKCSASQIFLRIGYEFDNPEFGFSNSLSYQNAFRVIVNLCRQHLTFPKVSKLNFVWHSWAAPRVKGVRLEDFYPGDEFVDWVGISIFEQIYPWSDDYSYLEEVLNFGLLHEKPLMIAESTPFGGIEEVASKHDIAASDVWNFWFQKVLNLIERYDIGMWCYINCSWDDQPMWKNVGFGETRISSNNVILKNWQEKVVKNTSRFLFAGSMKSCNQMTHIPLSKNSLNGLIKIKVMFASVLVLVILVAVCCCIVNFPNHTAKKGEQIGLLSHRYQILS